MSVSFSQKVLADFSLIPVLDQLYEALVGRRLLLTGGTGFFGKWLLALVWFLNQRGAGIEVTVVSRDPSRFLQAHPEYCEYPWLNWLASDIRELRSVLGGPLDLVLHAAADTSTTAHSRPLELFDSITDGARRIFALAVERGARRILLTGSGAQYGRLPDGEKVHEDYLGACSSCAASSAYGEAKRMQETLGAIYARYHGVDVVMTRCFAFSGPGLPLDAHFAIGNFVRDALSAEAVVLNSSGGAIRSYLHGADMAVWLLTLLVKGESGVAYNVGSDQAISIADLARRVVDRVAPGKPLRILGRSDDAERSFYVPDISRARELGLEVWTSLDKSIDSMAAWSRSGS